jgi:alkanesulfonate monooxygenase
MAIGLFGVLHPRLVSETIPPEGPSFDVDFIDRDARAQEEAGFDAVLLPTSAALADNFLTAARAATVTTRLKFLLAHRPGFIAPPVAARKLATLDQLTGGRVLVHITTGGRSAEQERDGDYADHDTRYERTEEYVDILRNLWTTKAPVTHEGKHFRFAGAISDVRPYQRETIPISVGGASDPAIKLAGERADLFPIWGETVASTAELLTRAKKIAEENNRKLDFALSIRVMLGDTEEDAWKNMRQAVVRAMEVRLWQKRGAVSAENTGTQRALKLVEEGEVLDERLYTGLAKATGAPGTATVLVGTAEQVADSMFRYYDIGIRNFLFNSLDPRIDPQIFGRDLVPLLRARATQREQIEQRTVSETAA